MILGLVSWHMPVILLVLSRECGNEPDSLQGPRPLSFVPGHHVGAPCGSAAPRALPEAQERGPAHGRGADTCVLPFFHGAARRFFAEVSCWFLDPRPAIFLGGPIPKTEPLKRRTRQSDCHHCSHRGPVSRVRPTSKIWRTWGTR